MLILGRDRMKNPDRGYAKTFLTQLEECLGLAHDRGVRIVANAGGLNPAGLADAVRALAERLGIPARVAHVEGDDLQPRAAELGLGSPLTANAYLGGWGIADCLNDGADVVVTGRVTDASVIVGSAAAHFGWGRTDYDQLAGAVVAGHVIECGIQATGGNFSFFTRNPRPDLRRLPTGRGLRRRLLGDHQAPRHRRPGQRRHRHRAAALRDHRRPLRQPGRHGPDGHHRAVCRRTRPGAHQRRGRRTAATDAEGVAEQHRRVPQRHDVRVDRSGHRGQGRVGATPARGHADGQARRAGMDAGPHRPPRCRHRGGRQRIAELRGPRPGSRQCGTQVLRGGSRIGVGELSGIHGHHPARRRSGVRRLHARLRRCRPGAAHRGARRRHPQRNHRLPQILWRWPRPMPRHCPTRCRPDRPGACRWA